MKTVEKIYDVNTGEISLIERDLSKKEIELMEAELQEIEKQARLTAEQAEKKSAILAKLGLTEQEMNILIG